MPHRSIETHTMPSPVCDIVPSPKIRAKQAMKPYAWTLLACCAVLGTAWAQTPDLGQAAVDSLIVMVTRGAVALCVFKVMAWGLIWRSVDSAVSMGRWVAAWAAGASLLVSSGSHRTFWDQVYVSALAAVGWAVLGFAVGVLCYLAIPKKSTSAHNNDHNSFETDTYVPKRAINLKKITAVVLSIAAVGLALVWWLGSNSYSNSLTEVSLIQREQLIRSRNELISAGYHHRSLLKTATEIETQYRAVSYDSSKLSDFDKIQLGVLTLANTNHRLLEQQEVTVKDLTDSELLALKHLMEKDK